MSSIQIRKQFLPTCKDNNNSLQLKALVTIFHQPLQQGFV